MTQPVEWQVRSTRRWSIWSKITATNAESLEERVEYFRSLKRNDGSPAYEIRALYDQPIPTRVIELMAQMEPEDHHDDNGPGDVVCPACGARMRMSWKGGQRMDDSRDLPHDEGCPTEWAKKFLGKE